MRMGQPSWLPFARLLSRARPACSAVRRACLCVARLPARSAQAGRQAGRRPRSGETPVFQGFSREAETALEESLGERVFGEGKGLFRAVPSSATPRNTSKVRRAEASVSAPGTIRGKAAPAALERPACSAVRRAGRRPSFSAFFLGVQEKGLAEGMGGKGGREGGIAEGWGFCRV